MNPEFQRKARRDKKGFLSEQYKEIQGEKIECGGTVKEVPGHVGGRFIETEHHLNQHVATSQVTNTAEHALSMRA